MIPPPHHLDARPSALLAELTSHLPEAEVAAHCARLLGGVPASEYRWLLPYLAGVPGDRYPSSGWPDYWPRVWGARGLRYVWVAEAEEAVLLGIGDTAWRVAEMCLKVAGLRDLPAAEEAAGLLSHELARIRAAALRTLGSCGDTEHAELVRAGLEDEAEEVRAAAARALAALEVRLDLLTDW